MAEVQTGDVLAGKYRVERVLGEGGMGVVVAATHLALDERVALKLMRADAMMREDGIQRFLREARAAVKLKSEHVARVQDVGTLDDGTPYIAMEYLEGSDLSRVLDERGTLPVDEAVDYLLQACDAIAEAHARGIVHRDLKPANLFITQGRDGKPLVKVLDFGISKVNVLGDRPESMTSSATLLGSPVYMSPEQMKSSRDVDGTTDIWSLGIILYEAVGGRVPFDEQTMGALMAKVLTEPPPDLTSLNERIPSELARVVARCLEKEPAQRYASIADLAVDLAPFAPGSAEGRVARIMSMRPLSLATAPGSLTPPGSTPSLASSPSLRESASILGVAATQALSDSKAITAAQPPARKNAAIFAAIAVATGVVAVAAFLGTRSAAPPPIPQAPTLAAAGPSAAAPTPAAPAPPPSATAAPPAASAVPASPSAATATATTTPSSSAIPPRSPAPRPASHPSSKPTAPPPDPFGNSRQ